MKVNSTGSGKPLVLLHSLLADSSAFEGLKERLLPGRRILTIDFPGYGSTPRSTAAIPQVALGVAEAIQKFGINEKYDLLGNGYGGFVSLSLAQQLPARVDRLVLLDSAAAFPPQGKMGVQAMKEAVEADGMKGVLGMALERLFPLEFRQERPDVVAICRDRILSMDPVAFASTCTNLMEVDLQSGLPLVTAKTLVVVGLEDKATPVALAREVAAGIAGAQLHELKGCGHAPHIQMTEAIAKLLQMFLDGGRPS
ncbi:alpha/beta fold hydrolase [Rhizobium sp. LEGMi135b]